MTLVDLTHPLGPSVYTPPGFSPVRIEQLPCPADAVLRDTEISLVVHVGTHVDAPSHLAGRPGDAAGLALDALIGPAVAWAIPCSAPREIAVDELRAARPEPRPGDQVYVWTGWDRWFGDPARYAAHPHLSAGAAAWLVERGVSLLGIDTPTPDLAVDARPAGFDYPVHRALLGADVLIAENVAGLGAVAGRRFTGHVCPVPIVGADGAPARVFASLEGDG
jgi:kynurenine formamidase